MQKSEYLKNMRRKIIKTKKERQPLNIKNIRMYILGTVCGLMSVATIFMTIETSTDGAQIAHLQQKETELLAKQQELQQQLVESLSVNNLTQTSTDLGFMKVNNLVYVNEPVSVAKLPGF